jgi:hypothetical protein
MARYLTNPHPAAVFEKLKIILKQERNLMHQALRKPIPRNATWDFACG